jgi:hypothetical protein
MYNIEVDKVEKRFIITLEGTLNLEESSAYLLELENTILGNDFSEYDLIVNTSGLKISSQDLEGQMKRGMEMVFSIPVKSRYNIVPKSAVTNLQANRIGKEFDLKEQFIIVHSFDEILAQVK